MIDTKHGRLVTELPQDAPAADVRALMDELAERVGLTGLVVARLYGPTGRLNHYQVDKNLITDVGDEYYMERAAGITSPPDQVSGMRLGSSNANVAAKSGTGSSITTYITGSSVAIDGGFPTSSKPAAARRIQWQSTWAAGVATATIWEAVITNETPRTDVAGAAGNTISRVVFGASIAKGAQDSLVLTWNHDGLGA